MVSSPSFDPNKNNLDENWDQLRQDDDHPLLSRSCQGLYPPGSIMKIVTAAVGLGKFPQLGNEYYDCQGQLTIEGRVLPDLRVHGRVDLEKALAKSCNSYFANLGLEIVVRPYGLLDFGWEKEFLDLRQKDSFRTEEFAKRQRTRGIRYGAGGNFGQPIVYGNGYRSYW